MHEICKYLQRYAVGNMPKYATANGKYASNMQVYVAICIKNMQ